MIKLSFLAFVLLPCTLLLGIQNKRKTDEQVSVSLPPVATMAVPVYPPMARLARIEGVVHVKVTTDGHKVVAAQSEDGHKMLAAAAENNVRTWEFATDEPVTFNVTYQYKLTVDSQERAQGPTVILRLPTEVQVIASPIPIIDPAPDPRQGTEKAPAKRTFENCPSDDGGHTKGPAEADPST